MDGITNRDPPGGTPGTDLTIDVANVHDLLAAQHPDLADLPILAFGSPVRSFGGEPAFPIRRVIA